MCRISPVHALSLGFWEGLVFAYKGFCLQRVTCSPIITFSLLVHACTLSRSPSVLVEERINTFSTVPGIIILPSKRVNLIVIFAEG